MSATWNKSKSPEEVKANLWARLKEFVKQTDGLTLGYIGNIERWGDDRQWHVWVDSLRADGRTTSIWSCEAKTLQIEDLQEAYQAVKIFRIGYAARVATEKAADKLLG